MYKLLLFFKQNIKAFTFVSLLALLYGITFIFIEFYTIPFSGVKDFIEILLQWLIITISTMGLLYLLCINKYIFAVTFPLLTLTCTILAYFRFTVNISITPMLIDLAMVNDCRTDMDVVSSWLIFFSLLSILLSIILVVYRFKNIRFTKLWIHFILSFILILITNENSLLSRPISQRLPYSIYYSMREYMEDRRTISDKRLIFKGKAECNSDSLTVVFVLGESLRSKNLHINGYDRHTTPYLDKENNIVSYPNIYSEYGFTHTSVPYILTRADSKHHDRAYTEKSFIDLMKQAKYHTSWLANQESVNTFIYFMKECDTLDYVNGGKSLYMYEKWLDEDMMKSYTRELNRNENRKFILLHTIGSHWFYNSHFPVSFTKYKPIVTSKVISSNSYNQMRNSYDNTILYSDYFWHQLIMKLKNRNAILIYLSDHSECMGEDGMFTHGADHPALHYPACFVWYSDKFSKLYPSKVKALKNNRMKHYNSAFLFNSVLDAADIKTDYIDTRLDIFK